MGTRSRIAIKNRDGSFRSIYCHWDGYPDGVGKTLAEHYTDPAKVEALLDLGDISSLRQEIGEKHPFDWRGEQYDYKSKFGDKAGKKVPKKKAEQWALWENWTLSYRRDRGEKNVAAHTDLTLVELQTRADECCGEYLYVFDQDTRTWTVCVPLSPDGETYGRKIKFNEFVAIENATEFFKEPQEAEEAA